MRTLILPLNALPKSFGGAYLFIFLNPKKVSLHHKKITSEDPPQTDGQLSRSRKAVLRARGSLMRIRHHFHREMTSASGITSAVASVLSVVCLTLLTVYVGFEHSAWHISIMRNSLRFIQAVFILNVILSFLSGRRPVSRFARTVMFAVDALILLSVLPWIYPHPANPWIPALEHFLYSRTYLYGSMAAYSIMILCTALMQMLGRRTNPALLMAGSFIFFITVGSFVLLMPKCTYHGISYIDSLFVTTSGVCITGLTTVDIPATFTPLGQFILCVLFQIGGLGVITFTSFFAIFFSGRQSVYSQLLVKDMVYSKTLNSLVPTIIYILSFTLVIEAVGALAIYFTIPEGLCPTEASRIWMAVFQSMSAFCNVGFSNVHGGMANPMLMSSSQGIYIVMSILLFLGGIGFPILVNVHDYILQSWRHGFRRLFGFRTTPTPRHVFDLNTKIAVTTTLIILAVSVTAFFLLESGNTMKGIALYDRIVQSVFNSLIPRSGGYSTLDPNAFLNVTLLIVIIQMWIGGSSQSMAGGVKVNTVGAILLNLRAIIRQYKGIPAFRRGIAVYSVRRANAVVTLSLVTAGTVAIVLMLLEPDMSAKSLIFETVSATFSVGSSLGITPYLSVASKVVICVAMFVGRVGLLSLLTGIMITHKDNSRYYPSENIIIN